MRLAAVACVRQVEHLMTDRRSRDALDLVERRADRAATREELDAAKAAAGAVCVAARNALESRYANATAQAAEAAYWAAEAAYWAAHSAEHPSVYNVRYPVLHAAWAVWAASDPDWDGDVAGWNEQVPQGTAEAWAAWVAGRDGAAVRNVQASLIRDVVGNPFRNVAVAPGWLAWHDGAVRNMAQAVYEARRWADLPVLADALEDAGCADAAILTHCRAGGVHVRGCWVLDLLLGKTPSRRRVRETTGRRAV
jgi:hypothetical protein